MKHLFTRVINRQGWTVDEALAYWGIEKKTYYRRCNNPRMKAQLLSMCRGLKEKEVDE